MDKELIKKVKEYFLSEKNYVDLPYKGEYEPLSPEQIKSLHSWLLKILKKHGIEVPTHRFRVKNIWGNWACYNKHRPLLSYITFGYRGYVHDVKKGLIIEYPAVAKYVYKERYLIPLRHKKGTSYVIMVDNAWDIAVARILHEFAHLISQKKMHESNLWLIEKPHGKIFQEVLHKLLKIMKKYSYVFEEIVR